MSDKARKQESKKARMQEIKKAGAQESKRAREQESKKASNSGWWGGGRVLDFARLRLSQLSLVKLKLGLSLAIIIL